MKAVFGRTISSSNRAAQEAFYVNNCGYYEAPQRDIHVRRLQGRRDYQLLCVAGGIMCVVHPGGEEELHRGGMFLYGPGVPQEYRFYAREDGEYLWIHFSGQGVPELLKQCGLETERSYLDVPCGIIGESIRSIVHELQAKRSCYEISCVGMLMTLLAQVSRRREGREGETVEKMRQIRVQMEREFSRPWRMEKCAATCGLSVSHFIRAFQAENGITPKAYLARVRINNARELLLHTDMKVGEVGKLCGYGDPLYFSRMFRKAMGVSPSEYRRG